VRLESELPAGFDVSGAVRIPDGGLVSGGSYDLFKTLPSGEIVVFVSDFQAGLLAQIPSRDRWEDPRAWPGLPVISDIDVFPNGDAVVLAASAPFSVDQDQRLWLLVFLGRDGTVQRFDQLTGGRLNERTLFLDGRGNIILSATWPPSGREAIISGNTLFEDFELAGQAPDMFRDASFFERTRGPFSGLAVIQDNWRKHSQLDWNYGDFSNWWYNLNLQSWIFVDPDAGATDFWLYHLNNDSWDYIDFSPSAH
jgi:hypothetical protein